MLGHSYGSVVVGVTARDHGLAADSVVFVGLARASASTTAADLGVPRRVWASTAPTT